jgi:glycosyltransferase involved in cell wall biosynthesis
MENCEAGLLLDVSRLIGRQWQNRLPTGIDRTCLAYVARYRNVARAVVQYRGSTAQLPPAISRDLFDLLLHQPPEETRRFLKLLLRILVSRLSFSNACNALYINVGHTGLETDAHIAWLQRSGVRPIYFIHDLIPLTHSEYCRPGEVKKHRRRLITVLRHGAGAIANSQDTLNDLRRFAKAIGMGEGVPALVAPLGVDPAFAMEGAADSAAIERPYFVLLGTIEGRKNHLLILNLWREMVRRLGPQCPRLIVIGQRGWECEQVVDMLERCEALQGHVLELSRCSDAQLGFYLKQARALLFPSFAEGYGLPLVEALARGTPVIASDLAVFRELAGNIPDYLSPVDGLGWMRAIEDHTSATSPMREAQVARMTGWRAPTWDAHFERVAQWMEQLRSPKASDEDWRCD